MEALKTWIEKRRMTQKAFGELIGVSQATVSDYLSGEISPTLDKLREIHAHTGLSFAKLIGQKADNKQNVGDSARRAAPG